RRLASGPARRLSEPRAGRADREPDAAHAPLRARADARDAQRRPCDRRSRCDSRRAARRRPRRRVRGAPAEHADRSRADRRLAANARAARSRIAMRLVRRAVAFAGLALALVVGGAPARSQSGDDALAGIWVSETAFGPALRGELTVTR